MSRSVRAGAVALAVCFAAGCAGPPASVPEKAAAGAAASGGKVEVESCGRQLSFAGAPRRAVTLDQSATEVLLELGLQDRMAGTSNLKTKIAPQYREAYGKVPVLSPKLLGGEQLRAAAPDVVVASFADHFTKDRSGTREELAALGLPTFLSAVDCPKENPAGKSPFDLLLDDYRNLGEVFGVEERADKLVREQRAALDKAKKDGAGVRGAPRVVWVYSVYGDAPYVAGKTAMPSEMSRIAGARNAFDDLDEDWPSVTWEQIADRDPDFLVIGDLSERGKPGDSAADKLKAIRGNPVMAQLDAVRKNRFVTVPGTEMDPSVRTVDALPRLTAGMRALGHGGR
ncbi:ABC transporter substrate-binding protein [Streptomyces sp. NBC_00237]|uniref:ABC transporter substrate-binding protein n=1 Tax=Streptomyces sp. NBC_00237 TaxID=2975687 RepID=UPI0022576E9A|nr:ABC transporter substrate-binding protein [Streptomyces sp. NBC_00237]MCX5201656.1 ABC transporter substrate-binding protein [Streptomyces sp. NBC_00237]